MKKILSLLLLVALIFGLAACGADEPTKEEVATEEDTTTEGTTEEKVQLTIYAQYADDDTKVPYDYAVEKVAEKFPNVELVLDIQAQDDGQKLLTYASTGNLPDIFQVGAAQIETLKESGNILVLNDYAEANGFIDKVVPSASNILYNQDGNIYAYPYAGNELVLWYYNKAIFEEYDVKVPETYEELLSAIETFNANDITPMSIFAKEGWITTALYDTFATQFVSEGIYGLDRGMTDITEPGYLTAAEKVVEVVEAGIFPDGATNLNYDQAAALFNEGEAAMFINGQWFITDATAALGDDVDWMYYPVIAGQEANKYAMSGGGSAGGYAVNPDSENVELAADVAAYISEMYCEAKYLYRGTSILALQVDSSLEPVEAFPPMMEKLATEIPNMTSTTKFAWGLEEPTFKVAMEDYSKFLLTPGYTAQDFIDEVKAVLDRIE